MFTFREDHLDVMSFRKEGFYGFYTIPFHVNRNHWVLLVVTPDGEVFWLDSMKRSLQTKTLMSPIKHLQKVCFLDHIILIDL